MKKVLFIIFIALITVVTGFSEETEKQGIFDMDEIPLSITYFGETVTHPGLMIGSEVELAGNGRHHLLWTANIGTYVHVRNHVGLFVNSEIGWRVTRPSGYFMDAFLGLGYLHVWPQGTVYEVVNNTVQEVTATGSPKFMPTFSWGFFGWQFDRFSIHSRLQFFGEYPYNSYMLPHITVQLGATIYFDTKKGRE